MNSLNSLSFVSIDYLVQIRVFYCSSNFIRVLLGTSFPHINSFEVDSSL